MSGATVMGRFQDGESLAGRAGQNQNLAGPARALSFGDRKITPVAFSRTEGLSKEPSCDRVGRYQRQKQALTSLQ